MAYKESTEGSFVRQTMVLNTVQEHFPNLKINEFATLHELQNTYLSHMYNTDSVTLDRQVILISLLECAMEKSVMENSGTDKDLRI